MRYRALGALCGMLVALCFVSEARADAKSDWFKTVLQFREHANVGFSFKQFGPVLVEARTAFALAKEEGKLNPRVLESSESFILKMQVTYEAWQIRFDYDDFVPPSSDPGANLVAINDVLNPGALLPLHDAGSVPMIYYPEAISLFISACAEHADSLLALNKSTQ